MGLLSDPGIPFLGIYPHTMSYSRDTYTSMLTDALFTIARKWNHHSVIN